MDKKKSGFLKTERCEKADGMTEFESRKRRIEDEYEALIAVKNEKLFSSDGILDRYRYPLLGAAHIPPRWKYDYNPDTNPHFMERLGVNAVFNPGAIKIGESYYVVARIEGKDRKSFFGVAGSTSPVDGFRFHEKPLVIAEHDDPDTNVYDMRVVCHEDGWIYGLFCSEKKDPAAPKTDMSSAVAQCGIVRTKDLVDWERLPDLRTPSPQQRNVVLHPEFVNGKYALYTRPQDAFIDAGSGGGIGFGLCDSMEHAVIARERIVDGRAYHTIKEAKNGQGPAPIKTEYGWLNLAHGVRACASGLRYVLYLFMTALDEPWRVTHTPSGYLLAPENEERTGDVSNVLFANGWIREGDDIYIYYASSDTRTHVASTTVERLCDYAMNTPRDPLRSALCVKQRLALIESNSRLS